MTGDVDRQDLEEREKREALDEWLADVEAEEGPFSPADEQRARAWVRERFPELFDASPWTPSAEGGDPAGS